MPACFSLRKKGVETLSKFVDIDNEMCAAFDVVPDEKKYYKGWYDIIGFKLAMGQSFAQIIEEFRKDVEEDPEYTFGADMIAIAIWLDEHYTSDAWMETGGRR